MTLTERHRLKLPYQEQEVSSYEDSKRNIRFNRYQRSHASLNLTDSAGKRKPKWISTGLTIKGNKKRAEKMLADTRKDFTIPKGQVSELSPDMAFSDYMRYWLKMMRTAVTETTYSSYCFNVEKHIIPYFEPLGVTLAGLQPRQIQSFYLHLSLIHI